MERASREADVLVVGGGVAGLACAVALADRGLGVVLSERAPQLGGRARSWADAATGDIVDIGPHVLHSEYRAFGALLERLGTRELVTWQPEKVITIASEPPVALRHRRLPPPFSLLPDFLRMPGLDARDMRSNTRVTWRALQFREEEVDALDRLGALDFLREHGVSEAMIDGFWRFAAMVVPNAPLERCSAASLLRVHSQLLGYKGIHFGFPAVGLGDLYVPGAQHAVQSAGGTVLVGDGVARLDEEHGRFRATLDSGGRVRARYAVIALPPAELARLAPGLAIPGLEPSPYVSTYLWLDRSVTAERFWALPWSPQRLNYDFYDLANIRPAWAGRASVIASNIIYSHRADGLDDAQIVAATLKELAIFAPEAGAAKVLHARVHRNPMGVVLPAPGMERARPATRTAIARLHLAGDWTRTAQPSSMESAALSGLRAAEAVLEDEGRPERIAPPPSPRAGLERLVGPSTDAE